MNGNAFLRVSVVLLLVGVVIGMYMGMTHNFIASPAHAHLNLAGGVLMFLAGLFYTARPDIPARSVGLHFVLHLVGGVLLPAGIYGTVTQQGWGEPVVGVGSVLTLLAMLVFTRNVFRAAP